MKAAIKTLQTLLFMLILLLMTMGYHRQILGTHWVKVYITHPGPDHKTQDEAHMTQVPGKLKRSMPKSIRGVTHR